MASVNREIRRLGIGLIVLFVALFVQLNYLQVVAAKRLQHDPRNFSAARVLLDQGHDLLRDTQLVHVRVRRVIRQ